jgi:hypothetical protein
MRELRRALLAAMGVTAAGCEAVEAQVLTPGDTDGDTDVDTDVERICEDAPLAEPELQGHVLACAPRELQDCDSWAADPTGLLVTVVGPHPDPEFCGYSAQVVCGPEPALEACCYVLDVSVWCEGRPFTVGGKARVAASGGSGWATSVGVGAVHDRIRERLAAEWSAVGAAEHASIASFARFVLELTALGAPAELVAEATRAMADEIVHARLAYGVASALLGEEVGPGPLDPRGAIADLDVRRIVLDCVREGCIGETLAAAEAAAARDVCADEATRDVLARIADDEARHAALAWKFVRWALHRHPELSADVLATLRGVSLGVAPGEDPDAAALARAGRLSGRAKHRVATATLREVVLPCAAALDQPNPSSRPPW